MTREEMIDRFCEVSWVEAEKVSPLMDDGTRRPPWNEWRDAHPEWYCGLRAIVTAGLAAVLD